MTRLNVNGARCAALFASGVQRSDAPSPAAVAEVISRTVRRLGIAGCASQMAQEFGDHPEAAASRMRWIRQLISQAPTAAAVQPVRTVWGRNPSGPARGPLGPAVGPPPWSRRPTPCTQRLTVPTAPPYQSGIGAPPILAPARARGRIRDHSDGAS